jgi:hypothetical protein
MLVAPGDGSAALRIFHMGPPLETDSLSETLPSTARLWQARFSQVSPEELSGVVREAEQFVERLSVRDGGRQAVARYSLAGHGVTEADPLEAGSAVCLRTSCATFVEHCYAKIEVDLVDETSLPLTSREELEARLELDPRMAHFMRSYLQELSWPCRVLLPAYQLRAFEKNDRNRPHRASLTDHPFPTVTTPAAVAPTLFLEETSPDA